MGSKSGERKGGRQKRGRCIWGNKETRGERKIEVRTDGHGGGEKKRTKEKVSGTWWL